MYEAVGGHEVIVKLVDDFYQIMRTDPNARECFLTHQGRDLEDSAMKLKAFLSGWLGGPKLYQEQFGHPRLRMRHSPFDIGETEARQWLYCMDQALAKSSIDVKVQDQIFHALTGVAQMLVNRVPTENRD